MNWFTQLLRPKVRALTQKTDTPDHLWTQCTQCEQMIFHKDLSEHFYVCRHCGKHMAWPLKDRLAHLFGESGYTTLSLPQVAPDPLHFKDQKRYTDRLKEARQKTGRQDGVVAAFGTVHKMPVVAVCFDFAFIGGSMGMAVGEALVHSAQYAIQNKALLMILPSSGGARMQEGIFSLMQMPRSALALRMVKDAGLTSLLLLLHPTTGGVAASFASLGDITWAEPGAIIGFTGARVIQETLRQPLPKGFQTSEFQKDHGFVDAIVPRGQLQSSLADLCKVLSATPPFSQHQHV